jgi:hypothetical protein
LESIAQTAAQAGRLRLWLTTEPAGGAGAMGFRVHVMSSQVCGVIAAVESWNSGNWVVSEAGTGVVRGMVVEEGIVGRLRELVGSLEGRLVITRGDLGVREESALFLRLKRELDVRNVFGMPTF